MNMVLKNTANPPGRRERKRLARMEAIVDAAMRIAASEGLGNVTTHRVAKDLDLAVGALYRYFPSKDAIIEAMQQRSLKDYSAALKSDLEGMEAWLSTQAMPSSDLVPLIAIALEYRRLVSVFPQHYHLNNQVMGNPKNVLPGTEGDRVVETMMALFRFLASYIESAQKSGALDANLEPLNGVILYWSSLRAVLGVHKLQAHDATIRGEELFHDMVTTMLRGSGATTADLSAAWTVAYEWQQQKRGETS